MSVTTIQMYHVKAETIHTIVSYLGTRPYNEVNQLIHAVLNEVGPQMQPTAQAPATSPEVKVEPSQNP